MRFLQPNGPAVLESPVACPAPSPSAASVTNILQSFVIGLTSQCNGRAEAFEHRLVAAGIHAA
jgi:hypothetical protein